MARSADHHGSLALALLVGASALSCHQAAPHVPVAASSTSSSTANTAPSQASAAQQAPLTGTKIGDTATFGARIVALKPYVVTANRMPAFKASYTLSEAAYLVWIEVIPGKSMALLYPTSGTAIAMAPTGERAADFRYAAVAGGGTSVENFAERARDEYYRCVASGERSAEEAQRRRRASQPKPQPKRDKDGKIIEAAPPPEPDYGIDMQTRRQIEAQCQGLLRSSGGGSGEVVKAERYLVMLASYAPLTAAQLNARLNALEVTASNVKGTIEAIAQGIYLDPHAVWAGHYVPW